MKLDYKKIFFVGLAFFLITLFWQTYDSVITKILIDKFGLNQFWSGIVMAMDNVLALFLIPLFGSISDKKNSKLGRRTPFIIVGTIIAAFAFVGLTFADNYQEAKIESQTTVVDQYTSIQDVELSYDDWRVIRDDIVFQWNVLLGQGVITPEKYHDFYQSVIDGDDSDDATNITDYNYERDHREGINEILSMSGGTLSDEDQTDLKDYFYLHLNERAWLVTSQSPATFIIFVVTLFIALVAMGTFRSPAVALMPDVTIKPLRSKANAVINLMGTFGGILAILLLKVYGLDKLSYVNYGPAFITVGILMLVLLGIFLWKVREPKLVKEREILDKELGLTEEEEAHELHESVEELSKDKRKSLFLILASVFLWFTGYNAVTTKLSDYAPKVLDLGFAMPLLIAQGAALVAFIPIGIIATKIGRRKTILIGIILLTICFGSVYFLTPDTAGIMYVIFAMTGIAWATINVNSYPMVVELAKGGNVGKYTGYYYAFSMAAQILTPIFSGFLMDTMSIHRKILLPYAAFFVLSSFVTMFFV